MNNDYESVFEDYVLAHSIAPHTIETHFKERGYMTFFNFITVSCLGNPKVKYSNTAKTTSSLIYLSDAVKEVYIEDVDVLYISNLYPGIMTKGDIAFNYPEYDKFLIALYDLRKEIKQRNIKNKTEVEIATNLLIKYYLNLVYGAINNNTSILSCNTENTREFIVKQAKHVMLNISAFFLNRSIPMYYVDTDEIFIPKMDSKLFEDLVKHYNETCGKIINTSLSTLVLERNGSGEEVQFVIFSNKKKYIFGNVSKIKQTKGITQVDNQKVLLQNKKYFGRNYDEIFPEYAI